METSKIETEFLETNYIILLENKITLKVEDKPLLLLSQFPQLKTWAFITAWNPLPEILSKSQNDFRNTQLQEQLTQGGFVFHPGIGVSKNEDWSEESFFIENISMESANAISLKYGQLAFLYGDLINGNHLIFTKN